MATQPTSPKVTPPAGGAKITIQNGTLVIDLYDPAMQQLVWQSTATKQLNPSSNAQKNQANLLKPFVTWALTLIRSGIDIWVLLSVTGLSRKFV